ncbi:hypothetical protein [Litchfieldella rifensis]|uniref:Uncharacterized protein n=1 Tax=Litchfieldella rifensis TaxID=762643 RepID=A0ABV7LI27_9GAMM
MGDAITGQFQPGTDTQVLWEEVAGTPWLTIRFHAIALVGPVVYRGLKLGYEVILKYTIPLQFVLLDGWWIQQTVIVFAPDAWFNLPRAVQPDDIAVAQAEMRAVLFLLFCG